MYLQSRPIFSRLPSAFSSIVLEPAGDVALGRLRVGEVAGLVRLDDVVLVRLPDLHPLVADLLGCRAGAGEMLAAGDLRRLAEHAVDAARDQLVVHVADRRAGGEAGGGVALAALGRDPELGDVALLARQLRRPLQVFLGGVGRLCDGGDIAVAFDTKADYRLAGLLDAVDHDLGPAVLDADHDDGGDVRVGAGADQRPEVQVEVFAELQAAIGVRQRHRALDVVGHRLAGGVGEIVQRQDDDVVAHADPAILTPPAPERGVVVFLRDGSAVLL